MIIIEFLVKTEEALELQRQSLTGEELIKNLPGWDSVSMLSLIAMIDRETGIVMEPERIDENMKLSDLLSTLKQE